MVPDNVLGNTFSSFFRNFFRIATAMVLVVLISIVLLIVFVLVGIGPENLLAIVNEAENQLVNDTALMVRMGISLGLYFVVMIVIGIMFNIFFKLLAAAGRTGEQPQYSMMIRTAWLRTWKIFKIGFLIMLPPMLLGAMITLPMLPQMMKDRPDPGPIIAYVLAIIVLYIAVIPYMIRISLSTTVGVFEDLTVIDSIKRSWEMTKGAGWLIFAYWLIYMVFTMVVGMALQFAVAGLSLIMENANGAILGLVVVVSLVLLIAQYAAQQLSPFLTYYIYYWRIDPQTIEVKSEKDYFFPNETYHTETISQMPEEKPAGSGANIADNPPEEQ